MKVSFKQAVFKLLDRFLESDRYLKWKSKQLPNEEVKAGLHFSTDRSVNIKKKYVVQKNKEIDFYQLRKTSDIFEIKLITVKESKTFYTVYHVASDRSFTLEQGAFYLLFSPIERGEVFQFQKFKRNA